MSKKILVLGLLAIMLCNTAYAAGETSWLDFLDEKSKEFLLADGEMVAAFDGTEIGVPLLVNEGMAGENYFLIPFNRNGETTGVLKIDGEEGYFEQAKALKAYENFLPVDKTEARETVKEMINPEKGQAVAIEFNYDISAAAEWQYGDYSRSPFDPYWKITAAGGEWIITQTGLLEEIKAITVKSADTNIVEMEEIPQSTSAFLVAGKFFEITNPDLGNGTFEAMLTFNYDDVDQDGKVDGTGINETKLNVYYYDLATAKWIIVPNPSIDAQANTISVTVDHFTLFMLAAPKPEPEPETPPQNTGGGGSFGGGGGSYPSLGLEIQGECAGEEIIASALNPAGNPAENATITIYTLAWKTIESKKTDKEGKASFVLEAGEYNARAEKTNYAMNTKKITIKECVEEQGEVLEEQPIGNQEGNELEEQTPAQTGQETQNLGQAEQAQGTETITGLFSLESLLNQEKATMAVMAGACAAIILGMTLYVKGRKKKK